MGRLLALALARAGCEIDLYEAGGPQAEGAAARVAAAMLAPLAESAVAPPSVVRMGHHALDALADAARIARRAGVLPARRHAGAVAPPGRGRGGAAAPRAGAHRRAGAGAARDAHARCRRHRGHRAGAGAALRAGRCCCPAKASSTTAPCSTPCWPRCRRSRRCRLHWHAPRTPDDFAPGAAGQPERVIDCRGLGARPQWNALRGVRGEVIRVHAPEVALQAADAAGASALPDLHRTQARRPVRDRCDRDRVGRHVAGQRALHARTAERRLRGAQRLRARRASSRSPPSAARRCPTTCRRVRELRPRVMQVNGLYRHGFMIAPAMLDVALELLATGRSALARAASASRTHQPRPAMNRPDQRQPLHAAAPARRWPTRSRSSRPSRPLPSPSTASSCHARTMLARAAGRRPHRSDPPRDGRLRTEAPP